MGPGGRPGRAAHALERALLAFGLLALGGVGFEAAGTELHRADQERRLHDLVARHQSGLRTEFDPEDARLVGRLEVPRLGLRAVVEEGVDAATLRRSAGHLPGTARPGERGNVVVAAHRDTHFRALRGIRSGDRLRFLTPHGTFDYVVTTIEIVEPSRIDVLAPRAGREATLVTCHPFGFVGPAPLRFVVRARQVGRAG